MVFLLFFSPKQKYQAKKKGIEQPIVKFFYCHIAEELSFMLLFQRVGGKGHHNNKLSICRTEEALSITYLASNCFFI